MKALSVFLDSWIIQDGNYENFAAGDVRAFALEFHSEAGLAPGSSALPRLIADPDGSYRVVGQVVHLTPEWWVVDFGVLAFWEAAPPAGAVLGGWMEGRVTFGVDPFFYFERLARTRDAPALIYDWTIEQIAIETAPFVEVSPRRLVRDPTRRGRKPIERTDAWTDDDGHGAYLLTCHRIDHPARRTHSTRARSSARQCRNQRRHDGE